MAVFCLALLPLSAQKNAGSGEYRYRKAIEILKNVEASFVHSQKAPLLLGQSVLEKFGTITIDNVNSKVLIK